MLLVLVPSTMCLRRVVKDGAMMAAARALRNTQHAAVPTGCYTLETQHAIRNAQLCPSAAPSCTIHNTQCTAVPIRCPIMHNTQYAMYSCAHRPPHRARYAMHNAQLCSPAASHGRYAIRNAQLCPLPAVLIHKEASQCTAFNALRKPYYSALARW